MIGLFDSGSGGLTVLTALRKKAPTADIVYFGDISHAPYGIKSAEDLAELTRKGVKLLQERGADVLVSACNSVSTSVLAGAADRMPFIEMSLPTAEYLKRHTGKRFLLIATPATISSGLYKKAVQGSVEIDCLSIPALAGSIEFGESNDVIVEILSNSFLLRKGERYDGLILGCTHYPLVRDLIVSVAQTYFGKIEVIDPALPVANAVCERFDMHGSGITRFLISKNSVEFSTRIKNLFPNSDYSIQIVNQILIPV